MKKRVGFTLVELLVVIAIIALLLSILMPSLQKVRAQAKTVLCQSNVRQWGSMLLMYTNDHNGRFMAGFNTTRGMWMIALGHYYNGVDKIRLCPNAQKFLSTAGGMMTTPFTAWGIYGDKGYANGWIPPFGEKGLYGSYGINEWVHDPPDVGDLYAITPAWIPKYWRTLNIKGASNIPAFGDSVWEGTAVFHTDLPPEIPANGAGAKYGMWNFCIPRHGLAINMVYLDLSVRKIPLKELWKQKWSSDFRTDKLIRSWPAWMNK